MLIYPFLEISSLYIQEYPVLTILGVVQCALATKYL